MTPVLENVFASTWWRYDSAPGDWFTHLYDWFNLPEDWIWLGIAGLVMLRFLRHRKTGLELLYGLASARLLIGLSRSMEAVVHAEMRQTPEPHSAVSFAAVYHVELLSCCQDLLKSIPIGWVPDSTGREIRPSLNPLFDAALLRDCV